MTDASVLLVVKEYDESLLRATRNMANLCVMNAKCVNVYQLLRFQKAIFTKAALDESPSGWHKEESGDETAHDIVKTVLITEKNSALQEQNKYCFKVHPDANKIEIKQAVQSCSMSRSNP